jgi:hypothetical protein
MFDQIQVNIRWDSLDRQPGVFSSIVGLFELPALCQGETR